MYKHMYKLVKKTQNKKTNNNMSELQAAGKKERSKVNNLIITNAIMKNQTAKKQNTCIFLADAVEDITNTCNCLLKNFDFSVKTSNE